MDQTNKSAVGQPPSKSSILGQIFKESHTRKSHFEKKSKCSENVYENDDMLNYSEGSGAYEARSDNTFNSSPTGNDIAGKPATSESRISSSKKHRKHDLDSFKKAIDEITKSVEKQGSPGHVEYTGQSEVTRYMALKGNKYDRKRTPDDIYQEVLYWPRMSSVAKPPTYPTVKQNGTLSSPLNFQNENRYNAGIAVKSQSASQKSKTYVDLSGTGKTVSNLVKFQKNARGVGKTGESESSSMPSNPENEATRFIDVRGNKYDKKPAFEDIYPENYVSGQYINIIRQSQQKKRIQRQTDYPKMDIGINKKKVIPPAVSETPKPKPPKRTLLQLLFCRKPKKGK